jgi:excisionase family DNA binding protein
MSDVMTIQEVASYLKVDYATAWRMCIVGTLRAFRVGQVWRIARADIERLMGRKPMRVVGQHSSQRAGQRAPLRPPLQRQFAAALATNP